MESKRKKILLTLISIFTLLLILTVSFFFLQYKQAQKILNLKIADEIYKKTGRKTKIEAISFSLLEGVVIKNICISEKNEEKDFFCSEKAVIKIDLFSALRKKLSFSEISFSKGKIILRKDKEKWNFSDLLLFLPQNDKPIYLNWYARNFSFKDFLIFIIPEEGKSEFLLGNSKIEINHHPNMPGNFEIKLDTLLNVYLKEKFISGHLNANYNLNFEYSKLSFLKGITKIKSIVLNDITAKELSLETEFFKLQEERNKRKFSVKLTLSELLIPSRNEIYRQIKEKTNILEKIFGRLIYPQNEFYAKDIKFSSNRDKENLVNIFEINSNFIYLLLESNLDFKKARDEINIKIKNQEKEIKLNSNSDLFKPKINPQMSETIEKLLKDFIIKFEKFISEKF